MPSPIPHFKKLNNLTSLWYCSALLRLQLKTFLEEALFLIITHCLNLSSLDVFYIISHTQSKLEWSLSKPREQYLVMQLVEYCMYPGAALVNKWQSWKDCALGHRDSVIPSFWSGRGSDKTASDHSETMIDKGSGFISWHYIQPSSNANQKMQWKFK